MKLTEKDKITLMRNGLIELLGKRGLSHLGLKINLTPNGESHIVIEGGNERETKLAKQILGVSDDDKLDLNQTIKTDMIDLNPSVSSVPKVDIRNKLKP